MLCYFHCVSEGTLLNELLYCVAQLTSPAFFASFIILTVLHSIRFIALLILRGSIKKSRSFIDQLCALVQKQVWRNTDEYPNCFTRGSSCCTFSWYLWIRCSLLEERCNRWLYCQGTNGFGTRIKWHSHRGWRRRHKFENWYTFRFFHSS